MGQAAFLGCFLIQKTKTESKAAAVLTQLPCGAMQIEDPAPALRRLRDRRDLAALAAKPWAVEAARRVRIKTCCCPAVFLTPSMCACTAVNLLLVGIRMTLCATGRHGVSGHQTRVPSSWAVSIPLFDGWTSCEQVAAQLSSSTAAAAEDRAAAAPPPAAANSSAEPPAGAAGDSAAAEVGDAARRLRMDPELVARAQAELRISRPPVLVNPPMPCHGSGSVGSCTRPCRRRRAQRQKLVHQPAAGLQDAC